MLASRGEPEAGCLGCLLQTEFTECVSHCTLARAPSMFTLLGEAVWREGCGNTSEWNQESAIGRQKNMEVVIGSSICRGLMRTPLYALLESQVAWSFQRKSAGKVDKCSRLPF